MTKTLITSRDPKGQQATTVFEAAYNKAKLDGEGAQRLNESKTFAGALLDLITTHSAKQPDYTLARSILGDDFVTPEEIAKARPDVTYTAEQIAQLSDSIPSADVLKWCKDNGYAVVAGTPSPMSLLDVRSAKSGHFYSKTEGWYADAKQKFSRADKVSLGWLMIRKTPVPNSTNKNWDEQSALLAKVEYVPNAAEMSWFITVFYDVRGVRLFEGVYVRTSSLDSGGDRVDVGGFGAKGLSVSNRWYYGRGSGLGVASARKS